MLANAVLANAALAKAVLANAVVTGWRATSRVTAGPRMATAHRDSRRLAQRPLSQLSTRRTSGAHQPDVQSITGYQPGRARWARQVATGWGGASRRAGASARRSVFRAPPTDKRSLMVGLRCPKASSGRRAAS